LLGHARIQFCSQEIDEKVENKMKIKIPQLVPDIGKEELLNLQEVINNNWLTEGPFSKIFLENLIKFTGAKYAVLANNGTLALFLALKAIGIKKGDEVIVPDFTFAASASSVSFAGATPVFVDVNISDLNIDTSRIEEKITQNTKAIMPVHVYGQSVDMDPILKIARKYNLKVIEDAAQGFGVLYNNTHVGTIGDVGIISFFADKTITTGEGAVVLTNDEKIYNKLRSMRNQGRENSGTFIHNSIGMNFRMTDLQCAIGVAQFDKFESIKKKKLENYKNYKSLLNKMEEITVLKNNPYSNIVPFRFNIMTKNKVNLIKYLQANGIETREFFYPLHLQPCFSYLDSKRMDYINSKIAFDQGICLPIHTSLLESDIEYICHHIKHFHQGK
jgi:perosamine synthetase